MASVARGQQAGARLRVRHHLGHLRTHRVGARLRKRRGRRREASSQHESRHLRHPVSFHLGPDQGNCLVSRPSNTLLVRNWTENEGRMLASSHSRFPPTPRNCQSVFGSRVEKSRKSCAIQQLAVAMSDRRLDPCRGIGRLINRPIPELQPRIRFQLPAARPAAAREAARHSFATGSCSLTNRLSERKLTPARRLSTPPFVNICRRFTQSVQTLRHLRGTIRRLTRRARRPSTSIHRGGCRGGAKLP